MLNKFAYEKITWFPGHMYRAMRLMEERISDVDIFVEVRDARVPISSFNKNIDNIIKEHSKEKIILLNKYDLCDRQKTDKTIEELRSLGYVAIPVSSKERGFDFSKILKLTRTVKSEKYSSVGLWIMIGGMPNVGKSNVINGLRILSKNFNNNQVSKTSNKPCQTTYVNGFKICAKPLSFVVDSPGILLPNITSAEMGLNLGLIGSIKDSIVGKPVLMDHLFSVLQTRGLDTMYKKYNLMARPRTPQEMIDRVAESFKLNDDDIAADKILKDFRFGSFGNYTLDDVYKLIN